VNEIGDVVVESSAGGVADFKTITQTDRKGYFVRTNPVAEKFITAFDLDRIRCDRDTGGVLENAYDVIVTRADQDELYQNMYANFMAMLEQSIVGLISEISPVIARMSGHVECVGGGTPSPEPEVDPEVVIVVRPPIAKGYEIEVKEEEESACEFKPPSGSREAVLVSGKNGFVLQLYSPFGFGITGDGEGGLTWTYTVGPVGVGETNFRMVEVVDMVRDGETLKLVLEETRFSDDFPDGCTRT
jgi:hypothetical protein